MYEYIYIVLTEGRVEDWMNNVLDEMHKTNRYITKKAIYDYGTVRERSRANWIMLYQGMICLASNQVWWTAEVEEVFYKVKLGNKNAMKEYLEQQNKQIDDLVLKGTLFLFVIRFLIYFHLYYFIYIVNIFVMQYVRNLPITID